MPTSRICWLLAGLLAVAQAAPPIDPGYFAPTKRITGLLFPNPENTTCWVVMGIQQTSSTPPVRQQPTASQVPRSVEGIVTLQVQNLEDSAFEDGFELTVEVPLDVLVSGATDAAVGVPKHGQNSTAAYKLLSPLSLAPDGGNSTFINTTVVARTQDFTPRRIYLNETRCALALQGFKPSDLPPETNLAPILAPILARLPLTDSISG